MDQRTGARPAEPWSVRVTEDAPLLAHLVHRLAPIAAAVVLPADHEVVVQGRPLVARRDCAWAVAVALAPMWDDAIPSDVDCTVVLSGTTYRTTGAEMRAVASGLDRSEWSDHVEVRVSGRGAGQVVSPPVAILG